MKRLPSFKSWVGQVSVNSTCGWIISSSSVSSSSVLPQGSLARMSFGSENAQEWKILESFGKYIFSHFSLWNTRKIELSKTFKDFSFPYIFLDKMSLFIVSILALLSASIWRSGSALLLIFRDTELDPIPYLPLVDPTPTRRRCHFDLSIFILLVSYAAYHVLLVLVFILLPPCGSLSRFTTMSSTKPFRDV